MLPGAAVWIFTRLAAAFVGIGDPNLVQEGFILAVVVAVVLWDARRRNEDLFLVADEVVWVAPGTTHSLGTPDAARQHGQFQREYLGGRGWPRST